MRLVDFILIIKSANNDAVRPKTPGRAHIGNHDVHFGFAEKEATCPRSYKNVEL